jgi:putative endonuclease
MRQLWIERNHWTAFKTGAWQKGFALLDVLAQGGKKAAKGPEHLELGRRGEEAALFYLRQQGFLVIAHGWQSGRVAGDLDLVAWHGDTLCFIEVKTRSSRTFASAEAAVDRGKRRSLRRVARHYMRQLPEQTLARFDILSVYFDDKLARSTARFELFPNAFDWSEPGEPAH